MNWNEYPESLGGKSAPRDGAIHSREPWFAMTPIEIIHDKSLTDGAVRLFTHMLWRYGQNQSNFEKRGTMAEALNVSDTTITNRIKELEAAGWLVVVERGNPSEGNFTTPFYHLFMFKQDSAKFRTSYRTADNETVRPKPKSKERKSRKGVGGNPKLHPPKGSASTQVHPLPPVNSSSPVPVNSSSHKLDTVYLESIKDSLPAGEVQPSTNSENKPPRKQNLIFNAIRDGWKLSGGSFVAKLEKLLLGKFVPSGNKKNDDRDVLWIDSNLDVGMTVDELNGFVAWYKGKGISFPTSPTLIQKNVYEYRGTRTPRIRIEPVPEPAPAYEQITPTEADEAIDFDSLINDLAEAKRVR